jgi:hypothetical protein
MVDQSLSGHIERVSYETFMQDIDDEETIPWWYKWESRVCRMLVLFWPRRINAALGQRGSCSDWLRPVTVGPTFHDEAKNTH